MIDYCKYADVFYGNGEVDHYAKEVPASKWFYIKALCGNTVPHAVLPFGKMSVGAYSGGYPCGYGTHYPNSCGTIPKFDTVHRIKGFSHIHQSGTGAIGYYYNYAIVSPFYGELESSREYYELKNEKARPGYYSAEFNDIACEVTVNRDTAFHHYTFKKDGGRLAIDFSNDGLNRLLKGRSAFVKDAEVKLTDNGRILFSGVLSGVKLY